MSADEMRPTAGKAFSEFLSWDIWVSGTGMGASY
jgi:hypothetical protein